MRVVSRMIKDIGLGSIGNLMRLHQILIKELRVASDQAIQGVIGSLWEVTSYFNRMDIWL